MPSEVLEGLRIQPDGRYLDCTFGRGGHSELILTRLGPEGRLLAFDKDLAAVNSAQAEKLKADGRFEIEYGSFAGLEAAVQRRGWSGKVAGVLMDLGVSSPQLDVAERGFSFLREGPLDMRMDTGRGISAAQWLAMVSEAELANVLKIFGEERFARRIARAVVEKRAHEALHSTAQLAALIEAAVPFREPGKHPATRSFQAIRIFINQELEELQVGLQQAVRVLTPAGRLAVISFHSLEDRIVKRFIRDQSRGGDYPAGLPVTAAAFQPQLRSLGRPLRAAPEEVAANPRARSAVLRLAERLA